MSFWRGRWLVGAINAVFSKEEGTLNISINPNPIRGNWHAGWVLDKHTLWSKRQSDGSFNTKRTELGEALYRLKYCGDREPLMPIARLTAMFIKDELGIEQELMGILPIPPSNRSRRFQPVVAICKEVGKILELDSPSDYLTKVKETAPLKDLEDRKSRAKQLDGAFAVKDLRFKGKGVMLLDDLYRSGETLTWATKVLLAKGRVSHVFVLALTRTRTKR